MITRRQLLGALAGSSAAMPLLAMLEADAAPLTYELKPEPLAPGVWMVAGAQEAITMRNGGAIANVVIFDSSDGAIIIDTGPSRRYGEALAALASRLTGKSIARVYITHFHPDHVFGNQAFAAETISAPSGVIEGLQQLGNDFADAMYRAAGDWMRGTELVLPRTVAHEGVEEIGGRRFRILVLGGHTSTDMVLFEERSGLLVAGDLVFVDRAPTTPHADLERWRTSLDALQAVEHAMLVPGHGPAEPGIRGIQQTRDWLAAVESLIREAFGKGLDINEVIGLPLPAWTSRIALARYEFERSVMHLYPKLEAGEWPRVDRKS